ncbi:phage tail sheath subtilisin-like domain-containing protein [Paenibacillus alvei]|uniref:phage tail sheath subtilisin-like domain-containing protein n=1 Tax=Paenibacillus alvei TaxID=44250 RepID=UPI000288D766|nr:phage tail sheath subtilisin-like domain-containing protein [Paenibacillus alvei]EJW14863.1 phage-like element pbsx protein XkdK [Paenibacillus alvei DSM 29]MCY9544728.1 phage tail sheath subtilisin-like domain-containing protein [Paenibacillus alvei]MCY9708382.1 phage tail sheath subtilisin-like domain-containing protein [Paenibacillus alvei]MEC0083266.1 phage tail sheath C-terminal domain-containing protein [Paenibacillus alvei]
MGLPKINIMFQGLGASAFMRGARGALAIVLKEDNHNGTFTLYKPTDAPSGLSDVNTKQIELAFMGAESTPSKIYLVIVKRDAAINDVLTELEKIRFDYLVYPEIAEDEKVKVATWIKSERKEGKMVKTVLPNHAADHEGVINFTTEDIKVGNVTYTTAEYCSRIAGIIAGTNPSVSVTYQPLMEVESVKAMPKQELDQAIDKGEFVLFHDGEKVKVGRGVNSLVTVTKDKGEDFKKIKVVEILDMWYSDIRRTLEDNYIGKYPNSYDNKVLLIMAIKAYNAGLETDALLDKGSEIGIDLDKQRNFLEGIGVDTSKMTEQQLKEANTRSKVFLRGKLRPLDAMEDIEITIGV